MNSKDLIDEQWKDCSHIEKCSRALFNIENAVNDGCLYPTVMDMHLTNAMSDVDKDKLIDCFVADIPLFIVVRPYIIQGDLFDEVDSIDVLDTLLSYKNDLYTPSKMLLAPAYAGKKFSELDIDIQDKLKRREIIAITIRVNTPSELEKNVVRLPYLYKGIY